LEYLQRKDTAQASADYDEALPVGPRQAVLHPYRGQPPPADGKSSAYLV
jgi:hypothetical protein